jgi:hypothetical protein
VPDESISGMEDKKRSLFDWADTPWTVAALLGVWGVSMGVEEFFLANVFMVLAGASCTVRLYKDSIQVRPSKNFAFALGIVIILAIVGVDIRLTAKKKASSEAKEGEIIRLTGEVGRLNGTVEKQSVALKEAQAHTDQHVSDIQDENKQLRASIDKKDAALVSIARQQFALNFFPQVFVSDNGTPNEVAIINNGKTNATITEIDVEGLPQEASNVPARLTPGPAGGVRFTLNDTVRNIIASRAPGGNAVRLPVDCAVQLTTQDKKKYLLGFTWLFDLKDGAVVKTAIIDRPIVEVTQP